MRDAALSGQHMKTRSCRCCFLLVATFRSWSQPSALEKLVKTLKATAGERSHGNRVIYITLFLPLAGEPETTRRPL